MIKKMRVQNFKAFKDTGDIEIRPITVLAGPNSSGKSSILHSLLLLKQTLEMGSKDNFLNLDGKYLQFSEFRELVYGNPPSQRCKLTYTFEIETAISASEAREYYPDTVLNEKVNRLPIKSRIELSFKPDKRMLNEYVILDYFSEDCFINGGLGPSLAITADVDGYKAVWRGTQLQRELQGTIHFDRSFLPSPFIFDSKKRDGENYIRSYPLPPITTNPVEDLRDELMQNLRFLGPLREPRRQYPYSSKRFLEIGIRGENTAPILANEKDRQIHYGLWGGPPKMRLLEAVNDAFRHLSTGTTIDVDLKEATSHKILMGNPSSRKKNSRNIMDMGFGFTQLLPIVLFSLRSPEKSLLLFEQPEIHLHPRLQAKLAEFFLELESSGKRIIVETHSEHLINRLRRRIAEDPKDELKEKVGILFVRSQQDKRGSKIEPLRVDSHGVIINWPEDFFPESADEAEAIFLAGLEKRKI